VSGEAQIITDREAVRKYYSRQLKAWVGDLGDGKHDGGPEDPRIGIIKVSAKTATYAVANRSVVGRAAEVAKGTLSGNAASVNKLRELSTEELQQCNDAISLPFFLLTTLYDDTFNVSLTLTRLGVTDTKPSSSYHREANAHIELEPAIC